MFGIFLGLLGYLNDFVTVVDDTGSVVGTGRILLENGDFLNTESGLRLDKE